MTWSPARIAAAALAGSLAWCGLAASAPLLQASGHPAAAFVIRLAQAPACHQIPGRCLHLAGYPMSLCARCTGLALGFALGCAALLSLYLRMPERAPAFPDRRLLAAAALPAAAEWLGELGGLWPSSSPVRAGVAVILGCAVCLFVLPAIHEMGGIVNDAIRRRLPPREPTHAARSG